jgi:chromosome segregation ATPase
MKIKWENIIKNPTIAHKISGSDLLELKQQIDELENEINNNKEFFEKEIQDLKEKYDFSRESSENALNMAQETISYLNDELSEFQEKPQGNNSIDPKQITELKEKLKKSLEMNANLESNISDKDKVILEKNKAITEKEKYIENIKTDLGKIQRENGSLKKEMELKQKGVTKIMEELSQKDKSIENVKEELEQKIIQKENNINELKTSLEENEKLIEELKGKITSLEMELQRAEKAPKILKKISKTMQFKGFLSDREFNEILNEFQEVKEEKILHEH